MNDNVIVEEDNTLTERSSKTFINKSKMIGLEDVIIEECNKDTYTISLERKENSHIVDMHSYNNSFIFNK